MIVMAGFAGLRAFGGMKQARALGLLADAPRRRSFRCPECHAEPPVGSFWVWPLHGEFDMFERDGTCSTCSQRFETAPCTECNKTSKRTDFYPTTTSGQGASAGW